MLVRNPRAPEQAACRTTQRSRPNSETPGYELFVGALSILSLVNIVLVSLLRDQATQTVVYFVDSIVSAVFLVDFLFRLRRAPARSDYLFRQYGWADLAASLPFPQVKVLRIFRLIRVARLLRRYGGRNIARSLIHDRAGSALLTLLFIAVLVLEFGSLAMLYVERSAPEANIKTASGAPVGPWGEVHTKFCALRDDAGLARSADELGLVPGVGLGCCADAPHGVAGLPNRLNW